MIAVTIIALLCPFAAIDFWDQRDKVSEVLDAEQESEESRTVRDHLDHLEDHVDTINQRLVDITCTLHNYPRLWEQVNHLATVQLLILQHLNLEHQVQPEQDRLISIGNLSVLKKSKERSG